MLTNEQILFVVVLLCAAFCVYLSTLERDDTEGAKEIDVVEEHYEETEEGDFR